MRLPFVAWFVISRVRLGFFLVSLTSLPFLPLMLPSLGVLNLAGSFRSFFLLLGFLSRSMLLGSFLRGIIFC
jgi:hypothetical protein